MKGTKEIVLHFPLTGGGPDQGPNDAGLEHFMGDVPKHLARECGQNSIDAAARPLSVSKPVRLTFSLIQVSIKDLPGIKDLKNSVIPACQNYYSNDPKAKKYCTAALDALSREEVPMLRIADYETTGLNGGDDERTGQWYSLVKSSGVSSKDAGSAGSFGIGKHAPFAASALRTVYYGTRTRSGNVAFQGVSKWWSHENDFSEVTQGTGFIGIYDAQNKKICRTVRESAHIPHIFARSEPGTDIWIPGFLQDGDWATEIAHHLLNNFWLAIHKGDIEFNVNGRDISKDNLERLLREFSGRSDFRAHYYYDALTSSKSIKEVQEFGLLGKMELSLLVCEDARFPKNVQGMRKTGMLIEEKRFSCRRHYAGVLLCIDDEGNRFLRSIEPPRHDKWERERITERGGKKEFDSMWDWVRKNVQKLNPKPSSEVMDVPNLSRFLPDFPEKESQQKEGDSSLESRPPQGDIPVTQTTAVVSVRRKDASDGGDDNGNGGGGDKEDGVHSDGGVGSAIAVPVRLRAIRLSSGSYRVIARPAIRGCGDIALQVVNDEGSLDAVEIKEAKMAGKVLTSTANVIKNVDLDPDVPLVFEIQLATFMPIVLTGIARMEKKVP